MVYKVCNKIFEKIKSKQRTTSLSVFILFDDVQDKLSLNVDSKFTFDWDFLI